MAKKRNVQGRLSLVRKEEYSEYRVVSGDPTFYTAWWPCRTKKEGMALKKELLRLNPHQGGGYHLIKLVTYLKHYKV